MLGTVNAPYKRRVAAEQLVAAIRALDIDWLVHLATLLTEVRPALVVALAECHGIDRNALKASFVAVRDHTGERSVAFEREIGI